MTDESLEFAPAAAIAEGLPKRDAAGHWVKGQSGNPRGKPRGARSKWRVGDPRAVRTWQARDCQVYYLRATSRWSGDFMMALQELALLLMARDLPKQMSGHCPQCGNKLSIDGRAAEETTVPLFGRMVHLRCAAKFAQSRWRQALKQIRAMRIVA